MGRITMHDLQELVRLHRLNTGCRETARLLGISPNTERDYRLVLGAAGLLEGPPEAVPPLSELRALVDAAKPRQLCAQQQSSVARWEPEIEALLRKGATPKAIYDKLRLQHGDAFEGSLSAVKRLCIRLRRAQGVDPGEVAIPVQTGPGEVAQVDFGSVGKRWDPSTQRMRKAYVFVMVLGHSRHQFCQLVFDQTVETWLRLHVEAFGAFGGVPRVIVPDNLKAAVIRAAFAIDEDAVLNLSYRELARHYGFKIDPTPPRSPEKKGKVESGVKYVKRNFFDARPDDDTEALVRELPRWVREIAGRRTHGTTGKQPLSHFEQVEQSALLALPSRAWESMVWREPMLRRDSHVLLGQARYSAPWRLIGRRLLARVTQHSVELYCDDTRVATHQVQPAGGISTKDEHLPPERRDYRHRDPAYWEQRAQRLGDGVASYVREVFDSDDVLHQVGKVQRIVLCLEEVPTERAVAACRRASYYGSYSTAAIKNILKKRLDELPLPEAVVRSSHYAERPRFARNVQELLDQPLEETDAPH